MSEASPKPAATSARGKILVGVAVVLVSALGYLAWSANRPHAPTPAGPDAPPRVAPRGPSRFAPATQRTLVRRPASRPSHLVPRRLPRAAARAFPAPIRHDRDDGKPRTNMTRADIRVAQANLHREADVCVDEALKSNPNLGLRMAVRYTIFVQGGEARALYPRVTKSLINDPEVEKCILSKITGARWNVGASDGILHVAESFNFKHLQRTHISD